MFSDTANTLGAVFFNVVQVTCFRERRPCSDHQRYILICFKKMHSVRCYILFCLNFFILLLFYLFYVTYLYQLPIREFPIRSVYIDKSSRLGPDVFRQTVEFRPIVWTSKRNHRGRKTTIGFLRFDSKKSVQRCCCPASAWIFAVLFYCKGYH